jgi:hypothetical protein
MEQAHNYDATTAVSIIFQIYFKIKTNDVRVSSRPPDTNRKSLVPLYVSERGVMDKHMHLNILYEAADPTCKYSSLGGDQEYVIYIKLYQRGNK